MASAVVRAYNGGLGAVPPVGSRGRAPGQGVRGLAESFCTFWHPMEWQHLRHFCVLLARDSIYAIARYMPSLVRPSVCPSVTRADQSKTFEVRITQPSPQSSPMTLVSWCRTAPWNSNGKIGSGGAKYKRGMKKRHIQPLPVLYSDSPGGAAIARWPWR